MAVPRHKLSKMKKNQRRSHHALSPRGRSICPRCNAAKLPHCVCAKCGYYRDEPKLPAAGI